MLDLSNELTSETASVYTEIGLQQGVLLALDVVTNLRREKNLKRCNMTMGNEDENLISKFYKMQEATCLQETMKDKEYQKAEHDIKESTKKLKTVLSYDGDSDIVQELLEKLDNKIRIYGKVTYIQGFHDAIHILNS